MQEEVENRTLTLVVSGTKFTGRMFKAAIRECSTVPIIIISAKGTTQNKIDLLRLGADDYITKPFDTRMESV